MTSSPPGSGSSSVRFCDLLAAEASGYLRRFASAMPVRQRQTLARLLRCRTPVMGGELYRCGDCHRFQYAYHSCNDRHCPRCGGPDAHDWLERQRQRLSLPVPFFMVTFTVPDPVRQWIRAHPRQGYELFFAASSQALRDIAGNLRNGGVQPAMLGILHTWSRTLMYHPHIHYVVPGGGPTHDFSRWHSFDPEFFLPLKPLGQRFRTLFKAALSDSDMACLPAKVWRQSWVIHIQPAGSGDKVLEYLARYVFKTATGNRTLTQRPNGSILWPYRNSRTGEKQTIVLEPHELIRRFLQHVLPRHFTRVRLFGWLHPAAKAKRQKVNELIRERNPTEEDLDVFDIVDDPLARVPPAEKINTDITPSCPSSAKACPHCQGLWIRVARWKPGRAPPVIPV